MQSTVKCLDFKQFRYSLSLAKGFFSKKFSQLSQDGRFFLKLFMRYIVIAFLVRYMYRLLKVARTLYSEQKQNKLDEM